MDSQMIIRTRHKRLPVLVLAALALTGRAAHVSAMTVTQYTYDTGDHIATVTDPRGLVTAYTHDGLGQLWRQVSSDTGTTSFAYDGYGRRSSMTRADGVLTTYGFDGLNRRVSVSAGGLTQRFAYDTCTNGVGRLCSASDTKGATSYTYTPEGWLAGRGFSIGVGVTGATYALGYDYDREGHLVTVNYPDNNQAYYTYSYGVVSAVTLTVGHTLVNGASAITYQPMNMGMASWTSSNGLSNTLSYDTDGRLTAISVPGVQSLGFTYDNANRVTQIGNGIDGNLTQSFGYDGMSRLQSVSSGADNESYQYDANGNRTMQMGTTNTISATSNQLTGSRAPSGRIGSSSTGYGYDANGNSTTTTVGQTVMSSYTYDAFNRMVGANGATYYVNPEGQRLSKQVTGVITNFAPDNANHMLAESVGSGWSDYVWLNGRLIGRIAGGQVYAIDDDQVGRPEVVTDAARNVVWRAQNFPFTQNVVVSNVTLNLGFPGQYYDAESSAWNNGFRDYKSGLGRYVESDPSGLGGGVNTYAYVGNNPITGIDPLGLCDSQKCTAARAALAALGQQLSSEGNAVTWAGIGLVTASGVGAIFAPEAAPIEIAGAEGGAGLIEVGGTASTLGGTITGYANGGALGAAKAFGASYILGKINKAAAGLGASSGVSQSSMTAVAGLLDQASDGIQAEEAACNDN